ncbi:uncharacterized protein [Dendrobates tinctorius]|uniref:uncharacterized protein isoform X1 n=1 Tax=Dendrobates tinctorius TaxID=92724 RepID=UPI003CC92FA0
MESLRSVIASMEEQDFMCSIDIQDAYLQVPIFSGHQKFLRFAIHQEHYQFVALPFGLATAPRAFTKIMAALMALLRIRGLVLFPYLDDILIKAPSFQQARLSLTIVLDTLSNFGWLVSREKSCLVPTQCLVFLGLLFDTRRSRVFLPQEKIVSLQQDVRSLQIARFPSLRTTMKILGKMMAATEAVPFAQFHARSLQHAFLSRWNRSALSLDRPDRLSYRTRQSLNWWLTSLADCNNGCQSPRQGGGVPHPHCSGSVVDSRDDSADQRPRDTGNLSHSLGEAPQGPACPDSDRQCHSGGIRQPPRRDTECLSPSRSVQDSSLGRGFSPDNFRGTHTRRRQLGRRFSQPQGSRGGRVVPTSGGISSALLSMGNPGCRSAGISPQQESPTVCIQVARSSCSGRRCSGHSLVAVRAPLPAPSPASSSQAVEEYQSRGNSSHPHRPELAQKVLVRRHRQPSRGRPLEASRQGRSTVSRSDLPPQFSAAQFNGVAVETKVLK